MKEHLLGCGNEDIANLVASNKDWLSLKENIKAMLSRKVGTDGHVEGVPEEKIKVPAPRGDNIVDSCMCSDDFLLSYLEGKGSSERQ